MITKNIFNIKSAGINITIILLVLTSGVANAQFPIAKKKIKLLRDTTSTTVVFDANTIKFYFKKEVIVKQLRKRLNETVYKDLSKKGVTDRNYTALLDKLIQKTDKVLYLKDSSLVFNTLSREVDSTVPTNDYKLAINKLLAYLLIKGNYAIFDVRSNSFVKFVHLNQIQEFDFKGWRQVLTLSYPNGQFIYEITSRRTSEGNDLINTL